MSRLVPLSAPGTRGPVAKVSELIASGVPPGRLYARDVSRPFRGLVCAPGLDPGDFEVRNAALRRLMRPGRFLSRRTAAMALGVPLLGASSPGAQSPGARSPGTAPPAEVGAIRPAKPPQRNGLAGHQVRREVLERVPDEASGWLPTPADIWGLLAPVSTVTGLVVAGDAIVSGPSRSTAALCTVADLARAMERFSGGTGAARLREALPLIRTGVESPAESQVRCLVVADGLPEPQTCCPVPVAGRILHADMGYPELRIAIEHQGAYHFTEGLERARRDNERFEAMKDAGWRVLLSTAHDLRDPRRFLARLRRAIAEALAGLP